MYIYNNGGAEPPRQGPTLDQVLMKRHSVKYAEAKRLINDCRQKLRMSRIEPWNDMLLLECEKQLNMGVAEPQNNNSPSVWKDTIVEDDQEPRTASVHDWLNGEDDPQPEIQPSNSFKFIHQQEEEVLDETEQDMTGFSYYEEELVVTEVGAETHHKEPERFEDEEEEDFEVVEEEVIEEVEEETLDDDDDDDDEEEDDETFDDEFSQATDSSKCLTTAKELGIRIVVTPEDPVDEGEEEDDEEEEEQEKEKAEPTATRPPTEIVLTKIEHQQDNDHVTAMTAESAASDIPTYIYIRVDRPPEVPDDEPLGQTFNIPQSKLTNNNKQRGGARFRLSVVKGLRRFAFFGGSKRKARMNEKTHKPTLLYI